MNEKDEGFVRRWSRLKQQVPQSEQNTADPEMPSSVSDAAQSPVAPPAAETDDEELDLSKLPPVESLGRDADYSIFMRKGVPDELRSKALRRLYQTNPELAGPDLMEMNAFDYTGTDGHKPLVQPVLGAIVGLVQDAVDRVTAPPGKNDPTNPEAGLHPAPVSNAEPESGSAPLASPPPAEGGPPKRG